MSTESEVSLAVAGAATQTLTLRMETHMSTLVEKINLLADAAADKAATTLDIMSTLQTNQGDLASLTTDNKNTLVGAIVELKSNINAVAATSDIDDTLTSAGSTWSSFKIDAAITSAIGALTGNAPEALDTLSEIAAALKDNPAVVTVLQEGLEKRVRFDQAQSLTPTERATALSNIGAAAQADLLTLVGRFEAFVVKIGDVDGADFAGRFNAAAGA